VVTCDTRRDRVREGGRRETLTVDIDGRRIECDIDRFLRFVQDFDVLDMDIQKGVAWVTQQTQTGD
jgi:hypothetical protein